MAREGGSCLRGRRDSHCSERYASYWNDFLLPPATKLGQGYIFTGVCDSVHKGGVPGRYPPGRHPPGTSPGETPPRQVPLWQTCPPRQVHPLADTTPSRYPPGRYTPLADTPSPQVYPPGQVSPLQTPPPRAGTPPPGLSTPPPGSKYTPS